MNFADYLYNMTEEDFKEAEEIFKISKDLPKTHELRLRVEALKLAFGGKQ